MSENFDSISIRSSAVLFSEQSTAKVINEHCYIDCRWLGLLGLLGLNNLKRKEGKRYSIVRRFRSVLLSFS